MTKNVTVLDENGNILGTTFEKRAEGLIKKGRARRVSDTEICLAPSASITEENMSEENLNNQSECSHDCSSCGVSDCASKKKTDFSSHVALKSVFLWNLI